MTRRTDIQVGFAPVAGAASLVYKPVSEAAVEAVGLSAGQMADFEVE